MEDEPMMMVRVYPRALFEAEIQAIYVGLIKPLRCRRCNLWFTNRSELMKHIWEAVSYTHLTLPTN